jgi:hypothetical protein
MSWQSGDPEARPKVYLPQSDGSTPLAYETYADPAEAHGWRKAFTDGDDTTVLAVVPGVPEGRRERLVRHRRARLTRRLAVAGGAAGVVVLGIAVAGVFDSGTAGVPDGTPLRTNGPVRLATGSAKPAAGSTAVSSAQPLAAPPATASASAVPADPSGGVDAASPGATTTAGTAPSAGASPTPTPSAPTASATSAVPTTSAAAPTPTASATSGSGGGHHHGHGHGGYGPN